jgi:hypothetical protein
MMQLGSVPLAEHLVPRRKQAPEHDLMRAILQDALDCVEKYRFATDAQGRGRFREARQWFLADEIDSRYSFRWVSRILGLDSNAVRKHLPVAPKQRTVLRAAPVSIPPVVFNAGARVIRERVGATVRVAGFRNAAAPERPHRWTDQRVEPRT